MLIITVWLLQLFFKVAICEISPLSLDFKVKQRENDLKDSWDGIAKRGLDVDTRFTPEAFAVYLLIGSDLQNVSVFVDPSSSDLSVVGTGSVGINQWYFNDYPSTFDNTTSTSFKRNDSAPIYSESQSVYIYGTGSWCQDDIIIGNTTIKGMDFVLKNYSSIPFGVLGLGFSDSVSTNTNSSTPYIYESFLTRLKNQGAISKAAYSMYFTRRGLNGTLLFGAIDHAKYTGVLSTLPMIETPQVGSKYTHYDNTPSVDHARKIQILVDGIDFSFKEETISLTKNTYFAAMFPTSSESSLPKTLLDNLAKALSSEKFEEYFGWRVPCFNDKDVTILFNFGVSTIRVPVKNMIKTRSSSCYLAILTYPDQEDFIVLGQDILQEAYVVYDNEEREISIAQVRNTKKQKIEEIISAVPSATVGTATPTTIGPMVRETPDSQVITGYKTVLPGKLWFRRNLASDNMPSLLWTIIEFISVVII